MQSQCRSIDFERLALTEPSAVAPGQSYIKASLLEFDPALPRSVLFAPAFKIFRVELVGLQKSKRSAEVFPLLFLIRHERYEPWILPKII